MAERNPIRSGVALAGLAALLFGLTAPFVQRAAAGTGALESAALLYLGAALAATLGRALREPRAELAFRGRQLVALAVVALCGGLLAPVLLVLGLRATDAVSAALLLVLEAPLTLLLARLFYREHLGVRVVLASTLIALGAALAIGAHAARPSSVLGGLLICAASLAWAFDNIASRKLADRDPVGVVAAKGFLGGGLGLAASLMLGEARATPIACAELLVIGACGYGASLLLYLRAQRIIGAGRTASVFAAAPFVGAAAALVLGAPLPGAGFALGTLLIACGVWLHATERHAHLHVHDTLEHAHEHSHDDGHHDHHHDPMPAGPHSHPHRHPNVVHSHAHSEDIHHRHKH